MKKTLMCCCVTTGIAAILFAPGQATAAPHHEVDRRGSIHFEPHREVHVAPVGSVHFEHPGVRWGPLVVHPRYAPEYIRRFRPGYRTLLIGPDSYYYYPALPVGCQTVVTVSGQYYYFCDGVYYMPYLYAGTTVYVAVPPPM